MSSVAEKLQHSDYSRLWLIEFGAGAANPPAYEGLWKAGKPTQNFGDLTPIFIPNPDQYGEFINAGQIKGAKDNPKMNIMAMMQMNVESTLLRLATRGCTHDLQVRVGFCEDPQDAVKGWEKIFVLEKAMAISYTTGGDLGALGPSERNVVQEDVGFTGTFFYEIIPLAFEESADSNIVHEIVDVKVCDRVTCGSCGIPSNGCDKIFALQISLASSPGLPAAVLYSSDGGETWANSIITTLAANMDPTKMACVGQNLVVVSNGEVALHYAKIADILGGTGSWTKVTTGFVAAHGPNAIFSTDPRHTWIVGDGGYVYFATDPTAGVTVENAGIVTTQNLSAIHGADQFNLLAVGASNAVIVSRNGGDTWQAITGPAVGVALNTCWMVDENNWWVGTAGGKLYYTRDAGSTWTEKTFSGSGAGQVRDIKFATRSVGYMSHDTATPVGRIFRTIDGGYSWHLATDENNLSFPTNTQIDAIATCDQTANGIFAGGKKSASDGILIKGVGAGAPISGAQSGS